MQNNLRHKFERKAKILQNSGFDGFPHVLQEFWMFFNSEPVLCTIGENLQTQFPDMTAKVRTLLSSGINIQTNSEEESVALAFEVLRQMANKVSDVGSFRPSLQAAVYPAEFVIWEYKNSQPEVDKKYLETFKERYLENFCLYIEEQIENTESKFKEQSKILNLLLRYKHRSEWFFQSELLNIYNTETANQTRKAEKMLALNLYSYLYDQGVEFFIEPSSKKGAIDLISLQPNPDECLLAEVKIFDGVSRGTLYLRKGFNQIHTYTKQFNKPFGYLVIFNVTDKDLSFESLTDSSGFHYISHGNKTISLITIDIYEHTKPVSQRDSMETVKIKEEDFIRYLENEENE